MSFAGEVADPGNPPTGCTFHPRCAECFAPCKQKTPELLNLLDGRCIACHLYGENPAPDGA